MKEVVLSRFVKTRFNLTTERTGVLSFSALAVENDVTTTYDPYEENNLAHNKDFVEQLIYMRKQADNWCKENQHEPVLKEDGSMVYSKFILNEHLLGLSKTMGFSRF